MILTSKQDISAQEAIILLVSKKGSISEGLPAIISDEIQLFLKEEATDKFLQFGGKFYLLVKEQKNDEAYRVIGHQARAKFPKKVVHVGIEANKNTALLIAEGLLLSNYQFIKYRKEQEKEKYALDSIDFSANLSDEQLTNLTIITDAVMWARDLVNEPVSSLNATDLATAIEQKLSSVDCEVKILEHSKIEALKMGGLLAVNKGSIDPPTFTIAEYKPKKAKNKKPIVLIGKGVVYDTGGLSLKPTAGSMDSMKCDMAGAACMAGTIYAIAALELPIHVVCLIPATDNRLSGNAYAPGDIVTMYDGTTVEVLNTDAEGRMILADALAYSDKWKPELVIDAATLTGAAVRAIGTKASVVMGNASKSLFNELDEAGFETHERVVQLPFWDDYFEEMKSKIADLNNLGGPYAGMITAGKFLEHFVKAPYIHMDIAGPAFLDKPQDYKGLGGTGVGIRLLVNFLQRIA